MVRTLTKPLTLISGGGGRSPLRVRVRTSVVLCHTVDVRISANEGWTVTENLENPIDAMGVPVAPGAPPEDEEPQP